MSSIGYFVQIVDDRLLAETSSCKPDVAVKGHQDQCITGDARDGVGVSITIMLVGDGRFPSSGCAQAVSVSSKGDWEAD